MQRRAAGGEAAAVTSEAPLIIERSFPGPIVDILTHSVTQVTTACLVSPMAKTTFRSENGAVTREIVYSCFPYLCDGVARQCTTSCTPPPPQGGFLPATGCATGAVCNLGACVVRSISCSADLTTSVSTTGETEACYPYGCNPVSGACRVTCASGSDCWKSSLSCGSDRTCT